MNSTIAPSAKKLEMLILQRLDPTVIRITCKQILCENHGITTHIVPEEIELNVDYECALCVIKQTKQNRAAVSVNA